MVGSSVGCDFAEYGVGAAVGIAGSSLGSEREVPDRGEMSPSGMGSVRRQLGPLSRRVPLWCRV